MPDYTCTKCKAKAYSKNPATRSVFLEDQRAGTLSNIMNITTSEKPNGLRQVAITFPYLESAVEKSKRPDEKLEADALSILQNIDPEVIKHMVCVHEWNIVPNTGDPW